MDNKDKPAFPFIEFNENGHGQTLVLNGSDSSTQFIPYQSGLTKREWLAGMALQGYLASFSGADKDPKPEVVAENVTVYIDALLKELEK